MSDDMLNLMAARYGSASGVITLESFVSLILRFECMNREYIHTIREVDERARLIYVFVSDSFEISHFVGFKYADDRLQLTSEPEE